MKIVFIAPRFHTNQTEIIRSLISFGNDVSFWVMFKGALEDHSLVVPTLLPTNRPFYMTMNELNYIKKFELDIRKTKEMLKKENPDLVILREKSKTMRIIYFICKIQGISTILYDQLPLYEQKRNIYKNVRRWVYNLCVPKVRYTPVLYRTYHDKMDPSFIIKSKNAYYVPFIVSLPTKTKEKYQTDGILHVLDVGKYRAYKNHHILVEAVSKVRKINLVKVTIIGQAVTDDEKKYFDNLQEHIDRLGLTDNFNLVTNVESREMTAYYLRNDVFVLCSTNELASISLLEAMSCGLSVIATNNNGTSALIEDNITGRIFNPIDSDALASIVEEYVERKGYTEKLGRSARQYIQQHHISKNYIDALDFILQNEGNGKSISSK